MDELQIQALIQALAKSQASMETLTKVLQSQQQYSQTRYSLRLLTCTSVPKGGGVKPDGGMYYYCGKHHILLDCVLIDNSDKKDAIQVAKEYGVRNMATYASDHPFIYYVANNVSINDAVMETGEYIIEDDRGGNPNLIQCVWVLELDNYVSGGRL